MSLLAVERMKLASTRSPWWSAGAAVVTSVGLTALLLASNTEFEGEATLASTQFAYQFAMTLIMVMATLAATTEYRVGTIKTTFLAVPRRKSVLTAKAAVVGLVSGLVGIVTAFASWALGVALLPGVDLSLNTVDAWRQVGGVGLVFMFAGILAVGIGVLLRHTAAAVTALLVWVLVAEKLLVVMPGIGAQVQGWLPFSAANTFLTAGVPSAQGSGAPVMGLQDSPWMALAYFAAIAVGTMVIALFVADRRDA